jgi:NADH:ubiquinone oxidoreductase subunit 6 (subunit J)
VNLLLFYILAAIIVVSAFMVVTLRNVFHSALFLVMAFFMVAGIYLMLNAEFLAAVQVLIYVGAVTILILFAIMLTHKIQSSSIKQTNQKVMPAAIISLLFLALAVFTIVRSFGSIAPEKPNAGVWTGSVSVKNLPSHDKIWNWTAVLEDKAGKNYFASSNLGLSPEVPSNDDMVQPFIEKNLPQGYILSSKADYSTKNTLYKDGQTIFLKVWSQDVNYANIARASWIISNINDTTQTVKINLSNSNPDQIGQLLLSQFVLPFEVVSVLLLMALVGAIVISRKDS